MIEHDKQVNVTIRVLLLTCAGAENGDRANVELQNFRVDDVSQRVDLAKLRLKLGLSDGE